MKKKSSIDIAQILPRLVKNKGWEVELERYELFRNWSSLVGEEIAEHASPLRVERGIFWVEVVNSAWLQQLQYQKLFILEELNAQLKLSSLADVRLVLKAGGKEPEKKEESTVHFVPPSAEEFEAFCRQTDWIEDEDSREALRNFWYLYHARKE